MAREFSSATVVLALARGGVPVGFAVAGRLRIPLDVIVARKLGVPWQPELAMGAISGRVRIDRVIRQLEISAEDVEEAIEREQAEMKRRDDLYRGGRPAIDLHGQSVVLVDDGLATGHTMLAAARHVRSLRPAKMIIGVPVGSKDACGRLCREVDDLICLATPEPFCAVGEWYRDFEQVGDAEVQKLLEENVNNSEAP